MGSPDEVHGGHPFVVAHRGASASRPEHTLAAYELALKEGADGVECDVRLTRDGHLVCVHDRRVDRTSTGTGLVSEMTLAQLRRLDYGAWHSGGQTGRTGLLTLDELVRLVLDWNRPVKIFVETKHPVRYGALVESKVLALLHRYGIAAPPSADLSRAVVMSFSAAAVWRIRRAAPLLPTVLLGDTSRVLGGSAATTVGATAVGPSIQTLREHPELVDRAAAQGRALYCWTVDHFEDVSLLPRRRGGVDRHQSSGSHQGVAAGRSGRCGTRPGRVVGPVCQAVSAPPATAGALASAAFVAISRATKSSMWNRLVPARSAVRTRVVIVATSSTCSLRNHCMNCSPR